MILIGVAPSGAAPTLSGIDAHFYQVLVRVEEVDRFYRPAGAAFGHRPLDNLHPVAGKLGHHLLQRPAGDKADIPRPHLRPIARLLPKQLQIDLLVAKPYRPAPAPKVMASILSTEL